MKIKKHHLIAVCALFLCISIAEAQSPIRDADYAFMSKQYEKALENYQKGFKKVQKNRVEANRVSFQIAECYRIMGDFKRAEQQYLRLEKKNYQKDQPIILFHLGSIYNTRSEYDKALKYYTDYQQRVPGDARIGVRIEGCQKAKVWLENPTRHEVENFKTVNGKQNDWAPNWGNPERQNQIIFTSNREGSIGKGTDQWTGTAFSDIYRTDKPKSKNTDWPGEWSPVLPFDEETELNSAVNEGEASANLKGGVIYFTRCPQDKKKVMSCYIYSAVKRGKTFGDIKMIELGPDSFNYVHPFISPDELTLYFASDKPDGYGGYDIYRATRAKKTDKFRIENCGPNVNTGGQEVYPTLRGDSILYFSSDGHPGLGGLDLFSSVLKNGRHQPAENLLVPINSSWDDMSIIFDDTPAIDPMSKAEYPEKGFFASNRPGGRGGDDIYYFYVRPIVFSLAGFIKNASNLALMDAVEVSLTGSDGSSSKTSTDVRGFYHFDKTKILANVTYTLNVRKKGFWEDENTTAQQTTIGLTENTDLKQDFLLNPIPEEPIILPEILYDLASAELKPQYKDSLLMVYNIMIQNPTIVVELRSHTDYRADDKYNEDLSQRRAQSCVDFLVNEKRIDPERIVPKGYGEYRPRKFNSDFVYNYGGKKYTFPKGTELTEKYITSLSDKNMQEAANQLNRRTEMFVLNNDYVPKGDSIGKATSTTIKVFKERTIPVTISNNVVKGKCIANGKTYDFQLAKKSSVITMDYAVATQMLKDMIISISDFDKKEAAIKPEDGTIIENSVLYIGELRIGDDYFENVSVTVKKGVGAAFMVGEDLIKEEWGNFTIDEKRSIILFE